MAPQLSSPWNEEGNLAEAKKLVDIWLDSNRNWDLITNHNRQWGFLQFFICLLIFPAFGLVTTKNFYF
jgi:hypothetical protein